MSPRKIGATRHLPSYMPGIHPALLPSTKNLTTADKRLLANKLAKKGTERVIAAEEGRAKIQMRLSAKAALARARFEKAMREIEKVMHEYARLTKKSPRSIFYSSARHTEHYGELNKVFVHNTFHIQVGPTHIQAATKLLEVAREKLKKAQEEKRN
jgi:hypothetical protein